MLLLFSPMEPKRDPPILACNHAIMQSSNQRISLTAHRRLEGSHEALPNAGWGMPPSPPPCTPSPTKVRTLSLSSGGARGGRGHHDCRVVATLLPQTRSTPVHVSPRPTPQRYRAARPDHPGGPASLAPRRVPTSMPRRLAVAPPFGRAARRRRCGAARCRSEPVLAPCLALRRVHSPAPAPQRRAAFRPRRVQAPVWRSEVPERARARSLPCAAPLVALGCLLRCVAFIAPHPRLNAAPPFGRAACRRRCGAARCRSEPVLAPCLVLRP